MNLKEFLKSKRISITQLAELLNIKKQTVCSQIKYWETGGQPSLKTIQKWSKVLKISNEKFIELISK